MTLPDGLTEPGRRTLHGVPEGFDAWVLADLARTTGSILHIAEDARRLERLSRNLRTVAPDVEVLSFPAWDTLPYDRASPSARVAARRVAALNRLAEPANGPRVVVTSAGGLLRRLAPPEALAGAALRLSSDEPVDAEALRNWLFRNGYSPAAELREPGDVLFGDDDISILVPGRPDPLRLEMPNGRIDAVLPPLSEVSLTGPSVDRFRSAYHAAFGAEAEGDTVYQTILAGRRYSGLEHWPPLFFTDTDTLFERMPGALVTLDEGAESMRDARLEQARDAFEARRRQLAASEKAGLPVCRPLPVDEVFLGEAAWEAGLEGRAVVTLTAGLGELSPGDLDAGGRPLTLTGEDEEDRVAALRADGRRVLIAVNDPDRRKGLARHLRREGVEAVASGDATGEEPIAVVALDLDAGFTAPGLAVVTSAEVLGEAVRRPSRRRTRRMVDDLTAEAAELAPGSLLVHLDHGIGLSDGLEIVDAAGVPHDCLRLLYRDEAKTYVPVENLDQLWPFGASDGAVPLDRMGGAIWAQRRDKVAESLRVAAATLVRTQAERVLARAEPIRPERRAYRRFVDRFPHEETPDQQAAIEAVLGDLASGRLMDRLICADVGFGKTEVALRAAFAVAMAGRQVAVVAPTTPLSHQHTEDFRERFAGFNVAVAELARNVSPSEAKAVKAGLKSGDIRIVVGTHALLSDSVEFADLGLLVVDEEQRLGVKQKERLKAMAGNTHVLTLTATPIPRTLQLAMAGLRDLSVIATPPLRRRPVRTEFIPFDIDAVAEALRAERARGGQGFYVCPRIAAIAPRVTLGEQVLIPEDFIRDANLRLAVYRRLATLDDPEERETFAAAIAGRFGPLPEAMETLMDLGALKCLSREAGVSALDIGPNGALLAFTEETAPDQESLERLAGRRPGLKIRPDGRIVLAAGDRPPEALRGTVRRLLRDLVRLRKAQTVSTKPQAESADSM